MGNPNEATETEEGPGRFVIVGIVSPESGMFLSRAADVFKTLEEVVEAVSKHAGKYSKGVFLDVQSGMPVRGILKRMTAGVNADLRRLVGAMEEERRMPEDGTPVG